MKKTERLNLKQNPEMFDVLGAEILGHLSTELVWMDHFFGCVQRVKTGKGKDRNYRIPAFYSTGLDYLDLTPDETLGNFCFITRHDPLGVSISRDGGEMSGDFSLIFWFSIDKMPEAAQRNTEWVKLSILTALKSLTLTAGRISLSEVFEDADNVFSGFSLDETENRYLMHPFCGMRFRCSFRMPTPPCL